MTTATLTRIDTETLCTAAREVTTDLYPRLQTLVAETPNQVSESQIGTTRGVTKFAIPGTLRPPTCTSTSTPRPAGTSRR